MVDGEKSLNPHEITMSAGEIAGHMSLGAAQCLRGGADPRHLKLGNDSHEVGKWLVIPPWPLCFCNRSFHHIFLLYLFYHMVPICLPYFTSIFTMLPAKRA